MITPPRAARRAPRCPLRAATLLASLVLSATAAAQQPVSMPMPRAEESSRTAVELLRQRLQRDLSDAVAAYPGLMGVQVMDLDGGWTAGVNAERVFPQGSAIKVPVLIELFRQAERRPALLRERRELAAGQLAGGSGVAGWFAPGSSALSLEDLAVLMIVLSDNTATNALIDAVTMDSVNATLDRLGLVRTRLRRKMIRPEQSARGEENVSTPAEAAALMARVHRCELPLSKAACARVRGILELPKDDAVRRPIPESVPVAFKPGDLEGVQTAWALVGLPDRPYVVAIMTTYGFDDNAAAIERVSALLYDHFRRLSRVSPYGVRVPLEVIEKVRHP